MRERKELIEPAPPRRRAVLLTDAPEPEVVVPAMGQKAWLGKSTERVPSINDMMDGVQVPLFKDEMYDAAREGVTLTEYTLGPCPPCSGWWDFRITNTSEEGRLWFKAGAVDGLWYQTPESTRPISRHSVVSGTMAWRGLSAPWPAGYPYPVPPPGITKASGRRRAE